MVDFHVLFEAFLRWAWEGKPAYTLFAIRFLCSIAGVLFAFFEDTIVAAFLGLGRGNCFERQKHQTEKHGYYMCGTQASRLLCNRISVFSGSSRQTGS